MTTLLAIGTAKGLWLARSDGAGWSLDGPHFLGVEVASVSVDTRRGTPRVLVGVRSEFWGPTVRWSDDLGATWHETEDGAIRFPADTGAALHRVWQLQPDRADRPGVVWAGCEPTSLWRSDDAGETFSIVRALWDHPHRPDWGPGFGGAAVHTVVPDPASDTVVLAMSTGGVYASADGTTDWQPRNKGISAGFAPDPYPEYGQCVHKVARDADGVRLYAQNHGGVYRSDDEGHSWVSIADGLPSDFGFPVLASPTVPGTAWVLPLDQQGRVPPEGRLRLHRTRDAGATWQEVGNGLPDDVWTAVLRDAMTVDTTGLYVGTRGGSVFASTDEGDSFVQVADHLPHVLSLRAAAV